MVKMAGVTRWNLGFIGMVALIFAQYGEYPHMSEILRWGTVALACLVMAIMSVRSVKGKQVFRLDLGDILVALTVIWAGITLAWTPDKIWSVTVWVNLCGLGMVYAAAKYLPGLVPPVVIAVTAGVVFLAMQGIQEIFGNHAGYMNENFVTEAILAVIPYAVLSGFRRNSRLSQFGAGMAGLAMLWLLLVNDSKIEYVVMVAWGFAGLLFFLPASQRVRWGATAMAAVILAGVFIVAFPFLWHLESIEVRKSLFLSSLAMILDAPLLGHGLASFDVVYPSYQEAFLHRFHVEDIRQLVSGALTAGAAHFDVMQTTLETGIIGAGLAIASIAVAMRQYLANRPQNPYGMAAFFSLVAILAAGLIGFPSHKAATAFLAAASIGLMQRSVAGKALLKIELSACARWMSGAMMVALMAGMLFINAMQAWAMYYFDMYKFAALEGAVTAQYTNINRAVKIWPLNQEIRRRLYPAEMQLFEYASLNQRPDLLQEFSLNIPKLERDYRISLATSPDYVLTLQRRVTYLGLVNRLKSDRQEVEQHLATMREKASLDPLTWLEEARARRFYGDLDAADEAVARGIKQAQYFKMKSALDSLLRLKLQIREQRELAKTVPSDVTAPH